MTIPAVDPRILSSDELDRALETWLLAEAAFWRTVEARLEGGRLGRGHYRAAFLLKRRPGLGVQELARLTGLSKQGASKALGELVKGGLAEVETGALDARRRPTRLTAAGEAFEASVSTALREFLASAYRSAGLEAAPGARRVLTAMAGPAALSRRKEEP